MNERQSNFQLFDSGPGTAIPVEFGAELPLLLPIKTQTPNPMKNPLIVPEKPLVPTLFQRASRAGEPTPRRASTPRQTVLGEMMLDSKRLEAILKEIVRRKKAATRRVLADRFNKLLSLNEGRRA